MNLSFKSYGINISTVTKNKTMCSLWVSDPEISEDPHSEPRIFAEGSNCLKMMYTSAENWYNKLTLEFQKLVEFLLRKVIFLQSTAPKAKQTTTTNWVLQETQSLTCWQNYLNYDSQHTDSYMKEKCSLCVSLLCRATQRVNLFSMDIQFYSYLDKSPNTKNAINKQ